MRKRSLMKVLCFGVALSLVMPIMVASAEGGVSGTKVKSYSKSIAGKSVNVVEFDSSKFTGYLALGQNKVGSVQNMSEMAKNNSAKVAVNGTFFNAYEKQEPYSPNGNLINKGELIHKFDNGTSFTISKSGKPQIGRMKTNINVTAQAANHVVGAYGINRTVGAEGIYLYTGRWGSSLGVKTGINIVVDAGNTVMKKVTGEKVGIPEGGFVLNVSGTSEALKRFVTNCSVGSQVTWDYEVSGFEDNDIMVAVGAGPMVLKNSQKMFNPSGEGFNDPKILSNGGARSAIGVKADGTVVIATTSAKVSELSGIMLSLGCVDAMNLDGGASSGLYANGKFVTSPGRKLSNILYFK